MMIWLDFRSIERFVLGFFCQLRSIEGTALSKHSGHSHDWTSGRNFELFLLAEVPPLCQSFAILPWTGSSRLPCACPPLLTKKWKKINRPLELSVAAAERSLHERLCFFFARTLVRSSLWEQIRTPGGRDVCCRSLSSLPPQSSPAKKMRQYASLTSLPLSDLRLKNGDLYFFSAGSWESQCDARFDSSPP